MVRFRGGFDSSDEARRLYQQDTLKHSWTQYQNYVNADPDRRAAIDAALDSIVNDGSQTALSEFIKRHPEAETPEVAAALSRYFRVRGISGPFDLFKLEAAYSEMLGEVE